MKDSKSLTNVILFTRGTKGDLYPFLRIGKGLKERGCNVSLLSNYCYANYARQAEINFVKLDDEASFDALNNTPEFHTQLPAKLKLYREHIINHMENEVSLIGEKVVKGDSIIVAHSNDYLSPLFAAEKFDMPVQLCMLAPSFVHGFSLFEAVLVSLSDELNGIRGRIGLDPVQDWKCWLKGFDGCFAFWPEWFSDEASEIVPDIDYLSFLSIDSVEATTLQKSVSDFVVGNFKNVLITHGTSHPFKDDYFEKAIHAFKGLEYKLIVSTPFRELLPESLPKNVMWVDFCPFHELLPLIDLIIHHGGIGTIRESITHKVPQLLIGQGFDRQHNGKIVHQLGVGDWITPKALSPEAVKQKVIDLLDNNAVVEKCVDYAPRLIDQQALERFYDRITQFDENRQPKNKLVTESIQHREVNKKKMLIKLLKSRSNRVAAE